jgi:hypothetical protein
MAQKGNVRRQQVTLTVLIAARTIVQSRLTSKLVGGYLALGNS